MKSILTEQKKCEIRKDRDFFDENRKYREILCETQRNSIHTLKQHRKISSSSMIIIIG
jgi:hypothetical protein